MREPHKHRDTIIAWANGESVEYKVGETWYDVLNPAWDAEIEYRIKPKVVKREGWVNVYRGGVSLYLTKEEADRRASECRIACIRIEWKEEV